MNDIDGPEARRRFLRAASLFAAALASPWSLRATAATQNGRALVGFQVPPTVKRLQQTFLTELHAQYEPDLGLAPVVMPGNSGMLAAETVAKSPTDGATVLLSPSSILTLGHVLRTGATDPADGLLPVAGICDMMLGFIVGPAVPPEVRTIADFIQWARAHPVAGRYGVPGLGTAPHFVGSQLARLADLPLHPVAYRGTAAMVDDVSAGSIPAAITVVPGPEDIAAYPKIRLLAVVGDRRASRLPDVPTLIESGLGQSIPTESLGVFLPVGTPEQKSGELAAAIDAVIATPALRAALDRAGATPVQTRGAGYAALIANERARWQALVTQNPFKGQD